MGPPDQASRDAANHYHSYSRGWREGSAGKAQNPLFIEHDNEEIRDAYLSGYQEGCIALDAALRAAEVRYGHTPSILRTQSLG